MRLEELIVQDFRKLRGRHVVRPAMSGITVVSGDNEEGKSTLLDALKRAFFMKHATSGEARDAILPFGHDATPAVVVTFHLGGRPYRLEKQFRRGGVRLERPDGILEGDAAELELARLLAFEWPGRGAARPEHMGLAGLFWVDQGTTFDAEQRPSPTAMRRLEPALAAQVAGLGRGERAPRLMTEVRRKRDEFWTGARGDTRGRLRELEKEVADLEAAVAELTAAEQAIEALLDRLAQTREKHSTWLAADHLGRARGAVEKTRAALAGIKALEEEARVREAERQAAASDVARLRAKSDRRRQLQEAIDEREAERAQFVRQQGELSPLLDRARRRRTAADAAEAEARAVVQAAETARETLGRQAERLRLQAQVADIERVAADVHAAVREAAEQTVLAEAERVTTAALAALEAEESGIGQARAALRAVATRLVLRPDRPEAAVSLDGAPLDPEQPIELTGPAILTLGGFGRVEVTPGGERLGDLRDALRAGEAALAAGLAGLGCANLADARRRLAAKERHERDALAARQRLAALLRASGMRDQAALDAAAIKARAQLASLADAAEAPGIDEAGLEAAREAAELALADARVRAAGIAGDRQAAAEKEAELGRQADNLARDAEHAAVEAAKLADQLAIERDELADEALTGELAAAQAKADAAGEAVVRIERELERASPEAARREAEQAARRLAQLEDEGKALDREADRLEAELRGAGGRGIGDQRADCQGRLDLARRRHARLLDEARAWRLLHDTLEAVDRARQDALVEPLERRIAPYLRQLMGDAELGLEADSLQLGRLKRGTAAEPFQSLSVGTREQLAVLVRLAIGDLLTEAQGEAPPLILDDALVYADSVRLARMKSILEDAAQRQQIIILTCRKEDYLGLDARYLTLEDCRTAPA
jgi:recombinational DNA repair ATPase RecF